MKMLAKVWLIGGAIAVAASGLPAHAQDFTGPPPMTVGADFAMAAAMRQARDNAAHRAPTAGPAVGAPQLRGGMVAPRGVNAAVLGFTPSLPARRANLAAFAARSRAADPAGAARLERLFASTDVVGAVDAKMRGLGLRATNLADAYALWWVLAWYATIGQDSHADRTTMGFVRAQAAAGLLAAPTAVRLTNAQKQQLAETLLVQAALIDQANTQAQGHPDQQRALAAAVARGARASGLDLATMVLTPQGFRPRGHSDARRTIPPRRLSR